MRVCVWVCICGCVCVKEREREKKEISCQRGEEKYLDFTTLKIEQKILLKINDDNLKRGKMQKLTKIFREETIPNFYAPHQIFIGFAKQFVRFFM